MIDDFVLPDFGDLTKPMLFQGTFKKVIDFSWRECELALNKSAILKNIDIISPQGMKVNLDVFRHGWYGDCFDANQIADLLNNKHGFALLDMGTFNYSMHRMCHLIEEKYNASSDIHVYGGVTDVSSSFGPHVDMPVNLIIQLEGISRWIVYKEQFPHGHFITKEEFKKLTTVIDCVMEPGDAILIPSLQAHKCDPKTKRISASIPFLINTNNTYHRNWIKL